MDFMKSIQDLIQRFKGEKQKQKFRPISTSKEFLRQDIKNAILRHNMEDIGKK